MVSKDCLDLGSFLLVLYLYSPTIVDLQSISRFIRVFHLPDMREISYFNINVEAQHLYQHMPEQKVENELATILWDLPVTTDKHILCNKPDLMV